MDDSQQLLAQLKDIHLPPPVSWWPPAPGWYIVIVLAIAVSVGGIHAWRAYRRRRRFRQSVKTELAQVANQLENQQTNEAIAALSILLKRIVITHKKPQACASLQGYDWLKYLETLHGEPWCDTPEGKILITAPYQKQQAKDVWPLYRRVEQLIVRRLC